VNIVNTNALGERKNVVPCACILCIDPVQLFEIFNGRNDLAGLLLLCVSRCCQLVCWKQCGQYDMHARTCANYG